MTARFYFGMALLLGSAMAAGPQPGQRTFASPREAAQALVDAAAHNDTAALLKLFGAQGKDIVESGDASEDKAGRERFASLAGQKMQVEQDKDGDRATITAGPEDWPFPVPLVREKDKWYFDSALGRTEVLARRVGRNEMTAIDVCRAYVEAQMEYASHARDGSGLLEYAQKIRSSPGKHDGLYWEGQEQGIVPKDFAEASAAMFAEGGKPVPYHGYYFHILKSQGPDAQGGAQDYLIKGKMMGGFALVAYPAEYGVSGVKTFMINHHGVVYEKDLGAGTATAARQLARFNPDKSWKVVSGE
jgi:hypothetical protein